MKELLHTTNAYRAIAASRAAGNLPQSALLIFPDGVYLRALLKECAKAYFGAEDGRTAALIEKESYLDCLFYPASGGKFTAEDAARVIDESLLLPAEARQKLFVLDGFHAYTPLVQNKLLKILEEPPENVYFLLGAENAHSVLPTVRSRMKTFTVPPFSEEAIEEALSRNYAAGNFRQAAAASGGLYSAAENFLRGGGEAFRLAREFLLTDNATLLIREAGDCDRQAFFSALSLLLRDILFYAAGQKKTVSTPDIGPLAEEFGIGAAEEALAAVREAELQNRFNANFAQSLFALFIRIRKEKEKWKRLS